MVHLRAHLTRRPSGLMAWVLLCLRLCLSLGWPMGAQAGTAPLTMGINALWIPGDAPMLKERFKKARALGITEVRLDWEWRQAEPTRGQYQWDKLDTLVRTASEEGISLLPIVHYAPPWALVKARKRDDVYELAPHEDAYADYARFLLECIRRYGPGGKASGTLKPFTPITHWQVWNEPNLKQFWGPDPDAKDFAKFTRVVHQTLAPVRGQIKLVHAGLSKSDVEFMWHLWDADPKHGETFDIMAVHSYLFDGNDGIRSPEAMDKDSSDAGPMGFVGNTKDGGHLGKVFNLQLFMTLRGSPGKPIWITEMGYFVAKHRLGVTEPEQGTRLQQTVDFIRRRLTDQPYGTGPRKLPANVQRLYWFSLEDYPSPEGLGSFGVYRPDGSMRPAGEALKALTKP